MKRTRFDNRKLWCAVEVAVLCWGWQHFCSIFFFFSEGLHCGLPKFLEMCDRGGFALNRNIVVWQWNPPWYTVSRAKAIYHAIAGSGAKKSVNFVDVGLYFHVVFPIWYMGIFHLLFLVHGNIPRSFKWMHEQFPWKYFHGFEYKYCIKCIIKLICAKNISCHIIHNT
jgi:hypothetical protein